MQKIKLNKTDLMVSPVCLGADRFGSARDKDTAFEMLDRFLEAGGNFIDTASLYARDFEAGISRSEEVLGQYLKARPGADIIIATKGGHHELSTMRTRINREEIVADLDESLRTLGLDHIDFYWLHRDRPEIPVEEIVDILEDQVKAGKIRFYGGSNYALERLQTADAYAKSIGVQGFSGVSNHYTPAVETPGCPLYNDNTLVTDTTDILPEYAKLGLAYIPYGSTAKGWFAKSLTGDASERAVKSFENETNRALRDLLVKKAEAENVPVQTALLRYMAEHGEKIGLQIVPITSCSKLEQLEDVVKF